LKAITVLCSLMNLFCNLLQVELYDWDNTGPEVLGEIPELSCERLHELGTELGLYSVGRMLTEKVTTLRNGAEQKASTTLVRCKTYNVAILSSCCCMCMSTHPKQKFMSQFDDMFLVGRTKLEQKLRRSSTMQRRRRRSYEMSFSRRPGSLAVTPRPRLSSL